jgi:hypothetical protein
MLKNVRDWMKAGGCVPRDPVLRDELLSLELVPRTDGKIQAEAKKDAKRRGLKSPNRFDCLALTFAYPVLAKTSARLSAAKRTRQYEPIGHRSVTWSCDSWMSRTRTFSSGYGST